MNDEEAKGSGPAPVDFIDREQEQVALLIEVSRRINSNADMSSILTKVVEYSLLLTRAERGFLFLADGTDHLKVKVALDAGGRSIIDEPVRISSGVVSAMLGDGIPIFLENVKLNPAYATRHSLLEMGVQYIMGIPLKIKGRILGFIYVDNKHSSRRFSPRDRQVLTSFADQAALALENSRLNKERSRFEREAATGKMAEKLLDTVSDCVTRLHEARESMGRDGDPAERLARVDREILSVAVTLHDQVREFGEYSEFINDQMYIRVGYHDLDAVVASVVERMAPVLERDGVQIHSSFNVGRQVAFDERWIARAVECVLRNAVEAVAGRPGPEVAVTTAPVPEGLLVEIRDNGPGVDPDMVERLVMPFYSSGKGARPGLGLTIAQRILDQHRGSLEIRTRKGRGTSVWIVIPSDLRPSMFPRPPRASVPPSAL